VNYVKQSRVVTRVVALTLSCFLGLTLQARAAQYQVPNDKKFAKQNLFVVESKTIVENFTARTNTVSGSVTFDPVAKTGSTTIMVNGSSLKTGLAVRDDHMRSDEWFNFEKQAQVKFVSTQVKHLSGDKYQVVGNLTLHGITKSVIADATVRLTKANSTTRKMGFAGDVVGVVAKFKIKITDFGVEHLAINTGKVAKVLDATLKIAASSK
jgi:polyisoprenoid-binding protein YceI